MGVNPLDPANNLEPAFNAAGVLFMISLCPSGDIAGNRIGAAFPASALNILETP